jgi:hypothetical protein
VPIPETDCHGYASGRGAAKCRVRRALGQGLHKGLYNRGDNSHLPKRQLASLRQVLIDVDMLRISWK